MFQKIKSIVSRELEKRNFLRDDVHKSDREGILYKAWGHVFTSQIPGDYVEFGVYRGDSLAKSYKKYVQFQNWLKGQLTTPEKWRHEVANNFIKHKAKFHGLDTFAGMPDNDEENVTYKGGTFTTDIVDVEKFCNEAGLKGEELILYKGLFEETSDQLRENLQGRKISILNVDCDLYVSAKTALEVAKPFLSLGSIILFDDYNAYSASNREGERKAFKEFQAESNLVWEPWQAYHFVGQSFICVDEKNI
jgi:O-methyltransferase